jgi:predicted Zn-dependent protease
MSVSVETQLDLAGRVLDLVREAAGAGAEAEVTVWREDLALTRFANSYIHQNVADSTTTVRLLLHLEGRTAVGSTTELGDGLRALVERTAAATRLSPPDPSWPGLAPPSPALTSGNVEEGTASASPEERALRVRTFVDAANGLTTAGYIRTVYRSAAFANSAGQSLAGATTEAAMDGIARTATSDGAARLASVRLADIDGALRGARAAAKARAGADPVELPPGQYEVVLEHGAVADILSNFAAYGFNGKAFIERRSFARLGEQQLDPAVTMIEDVTAPGAIGLPFDSEGTPKRRVEFVAGGVTRSVAHDRRSAAQAGVEVAGPAADSSVTALVAGVRRGLLVTDFWYTRVLDPRPLVVTGLTRNGVWLVEDGEITTPVKNFRFTQAYPQALSAGSVTGVGLHAVAQPADWGTESLVAPALRLASWNFTGGASG